MAGTTAGDHDFRQLSHFDGAREPAPPRDRLRELRRRAAALREELLDDTPVLYYRSFDLIRVPYPSRYAFLNAARLPTPFVHIVNKLFIVQFRAEGRLQTLLVSPSDIRANRETPFFKRLGDRFGPFRGLGERLIAPELGTVESCLARAGLEPGDVDYITYDHLHTQDVRRWLGSAGRPGYFPRARLLVMRQEWESARALLPPQADWYCPDGLSGVDPQRVVLLDGDVALGEGVALVRTPGHTEGNHSIVVRTQEGLFVTSENGVAPDNYAPARSAIPGLKRFAEDTGMEVVLNGNTLEGGLDQYMSMIVEKELAGRSERHPDFYNVVCSSEAREYWAFPGFKPTFAFGEIELGVPQRQVRMKGAA